MTSNNQGRRRVGEAEAAKVMGSKKLELEISVYGLLESEGVVHGL